ncbi:hypothetical protein D1872_305840 [compost metagenome]
MPGSLPSASRIRLIRRTASRECPPSSKKLSSMLTPRRPNTSANRSQRISSCGLRGALPPAASCISGIGRALRSSLPFGVSGIACMTTTADGTM